MKKFLIGFLGFGIFACFMPASPAFGQSTVQRGQPLFIQHCMICHGQTGGEQRAPAPETLMQLSPDAILSVLMTGVMSTQAKDLTDDQKRSIATFLAGRPPGMGDAGDRKRCRTNARPILHGGPLLRAGMERVGRRSGEHALPNGERRGSDRGAGSSAQAQMGVRVSKWNRYLQPANGRFRTRFCGQR